MPNSKNTITNRVLKAMVEIAESPVATAQERLNAVGLILKIKELAKLRDRTNLRKQPKPVIPSFSVLGSK